MLQAIVKILEQTCPGQFFVVVLVPFTKVTIVNLFLSTKQSRRKGNC